MSYFDLSSSFDNKRHMFPFILICALTSEVIGNSAMQNVFSGLFVQPLERPTDQPTMRALFFSFFKSICLKSEMGGSHTHEALVEAITQALLTVTVPEGYIEESAIAVFDRYITNSVGYAGKIMVIVWSASPGAIQSYTWYKADGREYLSREPFQEIAR